MSNPMLNYRLPMKNYLKMLEFLKGHQGRFGVAIIFIILSSLFEGVQLSFILPVVDRIFENKPIIIPNKVPAFIAHFVDKLNTHGCPYFILDDPFVFYDAF